MHNQLTEFDIINNMHRMAEFFEASMLVELSWSGPLVGRFELDEESVPIGGNKDSVGVVAPAEFVDEAPNGSSIPDNGGFDC